MPFRQLQIDATSAAAPTPSFRPITPTPTADTPAPVDSSKGMFTDGKVWNNPVGDFFEGLGANATKNVVDAWKSAYQGAKEGFSSGTVEGAVHGAARVAEGIVAPFGEALNDVTLGTVPKVINKAADAITSTKYSVDTLNKVNDFFDKHPDAKTFILQDLPTFINTASMGLGGGEVKGTNPIEVAKPFVNEVKNVASDIRAVGDNAVTPAPKAPKNNVILDEYTRSIKPSIAGKNSEAQIKAYQDKVLSGVDTILNNKNKLAFTDADGNVLKGEAPKSVDEFSQAIAQTKRAVFNEYDALNKASGAKGGAVDPRVVTADLDTIIGDASLGIAKPEAVAYANSLKDRLLYETQTNPDGTTVKTARPSLDTNVVQNLIEHWNQSLKAFYKNPTYDTASRAAIDALVANKFREALDSTIAKTEGPGYQELKNKYGALKAMEADVAKRQQVFARRNAKGLIDFGDIFSGQQVVHGILTLNPQQIATGLTGKAIQTFLKWKNNPDRGIQKMFDEAAKAKAEPLPPIEPKSDTGKAIKAGVDAVKKTPNKQGGFVSVNRDLKVPGFPAKAEPMVDNLLKEMQKKKVGASNVDPEGVKYDLKKEASDYQTRISTAKDIGYDKVDMKPFFDEKLAKMGSPIDGKYQAKLLPENLKNNYEGFPRDKELKGKDAEQQEQSILKYLYNKDAMREQYMKKYGKISNADDAKNLFKDIGYNGKNSANFQEAASELNKDVWRYNLKHNPEKRAVIFIGGSGAGKTSVVNKFFPNLEKSSAALLDGNFSDFNTSGIKRIREVIQAGKIPEFVYTYRDFMDAWENGVIKRLSNPAEGERVVPSSIFAKNHPGALDSVKELLRRGAEVRLLDNSLGEGKGAQLTVDKLGEIVYPKDIREQIVARTHELLKEGKITKAQHDKLIN